MTLKCAWCNEPGIEAVEKLSPWSIAKCTECERWNKLRPVDYWDGDLKRTEIVTEMVSSASMAGQIEPPRTPFTPKATDAELGRAITNIINRSKKS